MSTYIVPTWNPAQVSKVGWYANDNSYWFIVHDRDEFGGVDLPDSAVDAVHLSGGLDPAEPIRSVGELVQESWGEINWNTEVGFDAITCLRDDPTYDYLENSGVHFQQGVQAFLSDALDARRVTAWQRARGQPWMWPQPGRTAPALLPTKRA